MKNQLIRFSFVILFALSPLLIPSSPTASSVNAQEMQILVPNGFVVETVAEGMDLPTSFDFAPDGRIFVTEKAGRVRVIQNGELLPTPFVDLSDRINTVGDRGLMSVAVHPRFPAVPWIWLSYVYEPPEAAGFPDDGARVSRVVRIQASPGNSNVGLPSSEVVVVGKNSTFANIGNPERMDARPFTCYTPDFVPIQDCVPNEGNSHNIGTLRFGPDGALYVASGDGINYGFGSLRAQDLNVLAGKFLRVNPMTGNGYTNNPFYDGNPTSNRSKVFALGVRNPWRFNFHPSTGVLYSADVGNNTTEEINRVPPGANLGWPCYEGSRQNAFDPECDPVLSGSWPATFPYYEYEHEPAGRGAAMGGDFPRANRFPAGYRDSFFYGEFNIATIERLIEQPNGTVETETFAAGTYGVVELKFGGDGALYFVSVFYGKVYRIRYTATDNRAPVAVANASTTSGGAPLSVDFGSRSYDPDGDSIQHRWDFGDGNSSSDPNPTHTYESEGRFTARLTVLDGTNASASATIGINVGNNAPTARILAPRPNNPVRVGSRIPLVGSGNDPEDGVLSGDQLQWEVILHHNEHIHYDFFEDSGGRTSFVYTDHGDNTYLEVCLTATDSQNLADTSCVDLRAQEVVYTVQSVPSGIEVTYDGTPYITPFQVQAHVGSTRRLGALPTVETADGETLTFDRWSDRGELVHDVTILGLPRTFIVRYVDEDGNLPEAFSQDRGEVVNVTGETQPVRPSVDEPAATSPAASSSAANSSATSSSASSGAVTSSGSAAQGTVPAGSGTGRILWEKWTGVSGDTLADLTDHPGYPDSPDESDFLPALETPRTLDPDYGSRIRGYLHPPISGNYRFYIASDDQSGLWISRDANPANKFWIAGVSDWAGLRQWDKSPEQASGFVFLEAGQRYYVEVLHKQYDGKDNLAVGWQRPDGDIEVIDGQYLSPYQE